MKFKNEEKTILWLCLYTCACIYCISDPKTKDTAVASNRVCNLEKLVGTGTDQSKFTPRWYFDSKESLMCVSFLYSGTGGNENNFKTKSACLQKCSHAGNELVYFIFVISVNEKDLLSTCIYIINPKLFTVFNYQYPIQ